MLMTVMVVACAALPIAQSSSEQIRTRKAKELGGMSKLFSSVDPDAGLALGEIVAPGWLWGSASHEE